MPVRRVGGADSLHLDRSGSSVVEVFRLIAAGGEAVEAMLGVMGTSEGIVLG